MVVPNRRGKRSSTGRLRVCGTVVSGSRSTSLIITFARLVPRKLIISGVTISFTPYRDVSSAGSQDRGERGGQRSSRHGREQELPVAAQIPDARAKGDHQARGNQEERRHAREGLLNAAPAQKAPLQNITVVADRILAKGEQQEAADDERQNHRNQHAQQRRRKSLACLAFHGHAAAAPAIRRRILSAAPGSLSTMPARRP